ncbi:MULTISPECIES: PfaD family polyunsaturated fatty acid/polyketide biosynthesis protein [unclassified Streptomyces]|uniref:PfaD family polyunsaturated fatty acid/polyketide biosynthesis protein n=1 Tax=unclassified Streptomyces TaxID=2593676 RepID=UPI000DAF008C|nr:MULTISPECIES: PfaD family polyunsaturated fatty acid/polyketide biosynthesis protein [unclassified Streptomyces]PZT73409.1 2-nitropropane dioxygenase [Streptomyces sp. AC1-42T]PZT83603.1 2-nitropropane dioxygenase [Streptomyces sp. AC1-42W]
MSVLTASGSSVVPPDAFSPDAIAACARHIREPVHLVAGPDGRELGLVRGPVPSGRVLGTLPPLYPEWLGGRTFCEAHGVRFPYVAGEMANGIATTAMVAAMARAEMLGFFGAGGLGYAQVERAVDTLVRELGERRNWGVNLIHSPAEPELESRVAELLVRRGVPCVSASAYMELTPAVVWCAARGLRRGPDGEVVRRTRMLAKVSRPEMAERFLSPAPAALLDTLVAGGRLTREEADLAARVPVAEDVTVEADSGGHTDNRPLPVLLPRIAALRDTLCARFGYRRPVRVGAAGGLGTPDAVAAAFALGASYVVVGSVNQTAVEAGLSDEAKAMLCEADIADVAMAPAADMFELGVKLQVLSRGTMFARRAGRLYAAYRAHGSLEEIPGAVRATLERDVLHASFDEVWRRTRAFWEQRDPAEISRAEADPKHRMALVFRWYLGSSSRWAIEGETSRRADYQIWCGPAMGSFNRWVAGTPLADPARRDVVTIALSLLEGAAVLTRAHQLRAHGVPLPPEAFTYVPGGPA